MAVGVGAADGEGVFFGEAETGGGFAGAGEGGGVAEVVGGGVGVEEVEEVGCSVCWGCGWLVRGVFWFVGREGGGRGEAGGLEGLGERERERERGEGNFCWRG